MNEKYQLSYTAEEIDEKLGKIDDKLDASEFDDAKIEIANEIKAEVLTSLNYDIFGKVYNDKNIVINTELDDGTYVLKYENQDGTLVEIGKITVGVVTPDEPTIPTGNLFVADTCQLNKRVNSSGEYRDQDGTFVTDYINIGNVMASGGENKIHIKGFYIYQIKGISGNINGLYRGINYYDDNNTWLGQNVDYGSITPIVDENGNEVITLDSQYTTATKIRVCGLYYDSLSTDNMPPPIESTDQLSNCIITLNELIPV